MKCITGPHVQEFLAELGGVKSIDVVDELKKKDMDDFMLARHLKMDVKAIRRILYRLYDKKLVSFTKTRDEQKGWYIYTWKLESSRLGILLKERRTDAILKLSDQLAREKNTQFFKCTNGCMRLSFEKAFEILFLCPECGGRLEHFDNMCIVKQLEQYIEEADKEKLGG